MLKIAVLTAGIAMSGTLANASSISFLPEDLDSIPSATVGGVSVTGSTTDGLIGTITGGAFEGLHIANTDLAGSYELMFSQQIVSIEIYFQGLTAFSNGQSEYLGGFATDNGSISVGFANTDGLWGGDQGDALLSGGIISPNAPPANGFTDANFKVTYSGAGFTSFFFSHSQDDSTLGGVVIKQINIVTAPVPLPTTAVLLLGGLGGLGLMRRKNRKRAQAV